MSVSPADIQDLSILLASCGPHRLIDTLKECGHGWLEATWHPDDKVAYRYDANAQPLLVPGTVTQEAAVQAGEALIYRHRGTMRPEDGVPLLARARNVTFRGPVLRGDEVSIRVELTAELGPAYYVKASARTARGRVLTAELTFTATTDIPGAHVGATTDAAQESSER
ncbi:MAG: hypothetical protein AAFN74_08635 [Myxococcota bacterium]